MVVNAHFLTLISSFSGNHLNIPDLSRNRLIPEAGLGRSSLYKQKVSYIVPTVFPFSEEEGYGVRAPTY